MRRSHQFVAVGMAFLLLLSGASARSKHDRKGKKHTDAVATPAKSGDEGGDPPATPTKKDDPGAKPDGASAGQADPGSAGGPSAASSAVAGGDAKPATGGDVKVATKEKKAKRLRSTTLPLLEKNFSEPIAVALQREMSDVLKRNPRLDQKELDVRLAEFAQEMPFDQVELARTAYQNGREAFNKLELDSAILTLSDAVDQLIAVLPYIKKQELADAMMALAVAQQQRNKIPAMQSTLRRLVTWRPTYQVDSDQFPPAINDPLEAARSYQTQQPQGLVKVLSEPTGAQVFVDGEFAGTAPMTVEHLTVGEHYITFKKLGFKRGLRVANISKDRPAQVLGKLDRSEKFLLVEQAIARVGPTMGQKRLDKVVDNLRETLFLDHAIFLRMQRTATLSSGVEDVTVSAYLYDLRSRSLLSEKSEKVRVQNGVPAEGAMALLADKLYEGVDYDSVEQRPDDAPIPVAVQQTPLYKKWWFWTAIGVVVAGGASALAVGLTLREPSCPDGNTCTGNLVYSLQIPF